MTILVYLGVVIFALAIIILILGLIAPKSYAITRDVVINKNSLDVYNYIKYLKNQDNFNKWTMTDPNMKKDFRGTDGTVGFVYAWEGNRAAGKGEQEIKSLVEGKKLDAEVRFVRPFAAVANTSFITESQPANQTRVQWDLSSKMKYPMNAILLFMSMEKMLGKDMQTSLGILKKTLEN
jgi:hypothetical protein